MDELEPVKRAAEKGHTVESDPPFGLTRAERWTCTKCGRAVLRYLGHIYGSAVEEVCSG